MDESTALIIDREDIVENLKRAICFMKEHPEDRRRMSEKEKLQSRNYDETVYYKNFVKMLDEIIGE